MTNDFAGYIRATSYKIEDVRSIEDNQTTFVKKFDFDNEDVNNNDVNYQRSFSSDSIDEECLAHNESDGTSFNSQEWLVLDSNTKRLRAPRQIEFLLLLLQNPHYSSFISWLDEARGECQLHEPDQIAALWAKVKNRHTSGLMDYETFARGIRYYYKSGIMIKTYKKHVLRFRLPISISL